MPSQGILQSSSIDLIQPKTIDQAAETAADKLIRSIIEDITLPPFYQYAQDPIGFAYEVLGVQILTDHQQELMLSVRDRPATNVKAANSVGKSKSAAFLTLWWVFAVGGLVVTTAPTEAQVKEILWSEIRKEYAKNKHKLGGRITTTTLYYSEYARAYGFVSHDYDSNSFQGKHGQRILLVLDEACGISWQIDEAAESCVTSSENRLLRIGNPIKGNNPFALACSNHCMTIDAWSHPNVSWAYEQDEAGRHFLKPDVAAKICTGDDHEPILDQKYWDASLPRDIIPGAISIAWIERHRKKGEKHPFWISRVLAKFPTGVARSIISEELWRSARARYDEDPLFYDTLTARARARHGLDIGDGGDDHAYSRWKGYVLYVADVLPTYGDLEDIDRATNYAWKQVQHYGGSIAVDRVGVGAGSLSRLINLYRDHAYDEQGSAMGYNSNHRKHGVDVTKYYDRITQDAWTLREAMESGLVAIAPMPKEIEDRAIREFEVTSYEEVAGGVTRLDSKDKTRKLLEGRSPDLRDAILIGWSVKVLDPDAANETAIGDDRTSYTAAENFLESYEDPFADL